MQFMLKIECPSVAVYSPYDVIACNNNHMDLWVSQIFGELVKNHCWLEVVAAIHIIAMKL